MLGLVVFLQSAHFALSSPHRLGETVFPLWFPWVFGGSESLAALLFLVPATTVFGGYALLFIFAIAIAVHLLHGQYDVGGLIVYGMAAFVCMIYQNNSRTEARRG